MKLRSLSEELADLSPEQRSLLELRARRLATAAAEEKEEALVYFAEFPVGEHAYAVPLEAVRAALPLRLVTPVPLSPPHIVGVLRFQGRIISAVSVEALLGVRGWQQDPAVLLVVDPGFGELTAIDCERIPVAMALPRSAVEAALQGSDAAVVEVMTPDRRQVHLIKLGQLLDRRHRSDRAD